MTSKRIIVLHDERQASQAAPPLMQLGNLKPLTANGLLTDQLGRQLHDLRISVTDRCNFRCSYCMPKEVFDKNYPYLPHSSLLSFEEIARLARIFMSHGVRKIRLTGGEPLLRKNLEVLIEQLAALRTQDGEKLDLTLTTNGSLLAKKAIALKAAGLQRVTVSLDGLDDAVFRSMNDVDFPVADVLAGIEAARQAGLGLDKYGNYSGIKINMVVKRGTNADQILPMARHFKGTGMVLRFIEYMDVGATNGWRMDDVLPSAEVIKLIQSEMPLVQLEATQRGETAQRWGYADATGKHDPSLGEIGVISSVTQAFCSDCNRARLSTEGKLYLCLFASQGYDLRPLLREPSTGTDTCIRDIDKDATIDAKITSALAHIWQDRNDRYSELRSSMPPETTSATTSSKRVEMSYIGG
jgi:GTP 3',8-cyclase